MCLQTSKDPGIFVSASIRCCVRACERAQLRAIAMRGTTIKVIQELLGHSTISMTMRYAHLERNESGGAGSRTLTGYQL